MSPASLEGQTLGKYRLLEPLGRGGMAQVYRAFHPQLERYVAIKVLRSDLVEEEEFLARFTREARAVAALRHPNIVQIYDFDVQEGVYYMVMELLEGDTLKAYLNSYRTQSGTLPYNEMARILLDILAGLEYAHSEGIVHRDIKPANIMLTRRGQTVLTDFGIAQIVGGTHYTVSGALMGTLSYMAPEQGLRGQCDSRSDIYSLGIVFFEMLTGRPPFDADTPLAILMKHVNDPLPLPTRLDPSIPRQLESVVLKALAKLPEDRFQSAASMASAVRDASQQAGLHLPERISLPLSLAASQQAYGAQPVYSGAERAGLADDGLSAEDTDSDLERKLGFVEQLADPVEPPATGAGSGALALSAAPVSGVAVDSHPGTVTPLPGRLGALHVPEIPVAAAAVTGAVLLIGANLAGVFVGIFTGNWGFFQHGWPVELLLVAIMLSLLQISLSTHWLLIPSSIILGAGLLLTFYQLTNLWHFWLPWLLVPALIAASITAAVWLNRQEALKKPLARRWALFMLLVSVAAAAVLTQVSIFLK